MLCLKQITPLLLIVLACGWAAPAPADTIIAAFDSRSETDGDPGPTNATTTDLAVGLVSSGRSFRSYLTFDLTGAIAVGTGGSVQLVLSTTTSSGNPNENNTDAIAQTFTLFQVAADWDGASAPGPEGTMLDAVAVTPSIGNHSDALVFNSTALKNAYNSALGGSLYLGIKSNLEGQGARSFVWYGSSEDIGSEPVLNTTIPEPGSLALLGVGTLFFWCRRRR